MSVRKLIVDGITVPVWSSTGIRQEYAPIEAVSRTRTADGSLIVRELWSGKLRTTISSDGPAPPGLRAIDNSNPYEIWCIAPIAINSASNVITLPATKRSDTGSEPLGFAEVGAEMVPTPLVLSGLDDTTATLTTVSGATQYQVRYFPKLTVMSPPVRFSLTRGVGYDWTLEAEEV